MVQYKAFMGWNKLVANNVVILCSVLYRKRLSTVEQLKLTVARQQSRRHHIMLQGHQTLTEIFTCLFIMCQLCGY